MGIRSHRGAVRNSSRSRVRRGTVGPRAQDLRRRDQNDHADRRSGIDFHDRRTLALTLESSSFRRPGAKLAEGYFSARFARAAYSTPFAILYTLSVTGTGTPSSFAFLTT